MKLNELALGHEYIHKTWGRVLLIAPHPHDGAYLVIERASFMAPDDDTLVFDACEASDLEPAQGSQWPYLGLQKPKPPEGYEAVYSGLNNGDLIAAMLRDGAGS